MKKITDMEMHVSSFYLFGFADALRDNILQYYGYKTKVLEFVDFDASHKNLLIRAQLTNNSYNEKIKEEIDDIIKRLGINQTLYKLQFEK